MTFEFKRKLLSFGSSINKNIILKLRFLQLRNICIFVMYVVHDRVGEIVGLVGGGSGVEQEAKGFR